jgi:hypothetical protein
MTDREKGAIHGSAEGTSDELVLAAVRRAALHDPRARGRTPIWTLLEHLDIPRRSSRARAIRAQLPALERHGLLERGSARGVPMWALTRAGARKLGRAERNSEPIALPESPQHRAWRHARDAGGQEVGRFAGGLRATLSEAQQMLEGDREAPLPSDAWLELSARLARECRLLASARHCACEWPEPDERRADFDALSGPGDELLDHDRLRALRALRTGRRNIRLWREPG